MDVKGKIDEIKKYGFTALPGFLDDNASNTLISSVKPHLNKAEVGYGTAKNKDITLAMFRTVSSRLVMRDIIFNTELRQILKSFMKNPFVEHTKILVKAPKGPDTPWHQDGAFWEDFDPQKSMLSLWIALEPVTLENGCLEIIKTRTPVNDVIPHLVVRNGKELEIPEKDIQKTLEDGDGLPMELRPGDALIFDSTTIHRALPNQTDEARIGIKIVFQDKEKRLAGVPKHKSSIEMFGYKGLINKTWPCALTARRA